MTSEFDSPSAVYLHQIRLLEQERDALKAEVQKLKQHHELGLDYCCSCGDFDCERWDRWRKP